MKQRIDYKKASPEAYKAMLAVETCVSDLEQAALAWAEAVTQLSSTAVSDELYQQARLHFDEKALVDLTLSIVAINGWNRLAVAFRIPPGS